MSNPVEQSIVPAWGVLGMVGVITLEKVNTFVAVLVGICTLIYLGIKIFKEIRSIR